MSKHNTRVKVKTTLIKVINDATNEVSTIVEHGRLTIPECKEIANERGLVFVSKQTVVREYTVPVTDVLNIIA